jgi:hypothetical protein
MDAFSSLNCRVFRYYAQQNPVCHCLFWQHGSIFSRLRLALAREITRTKSLPHTFNRYSSIMRQLVICPHLFIVHFKFSRMQKLLLRLFQLLVFLLAPLWLLAQVTVSGTVNNDKGLPVQAHLSG